MADTAVSPTPSTAASLGNHKDSLRSSLGGARSPTSVIGSPLSEKQVQQYQTAQKAILAEDTAYLSSYPELTTLLATFCKAVLKEKPSDVRAFAKEYFNRPVDAGPE